MTRAHSLRLLVLTTASLAAVLGGCRSRVPDAKPSPDSGRPPASSKPEPPRRAEEWPSQPGARWPADFNVMNAAAHPYLPWLAVACAWGEKEEGAILVFDAQAGVLRSVTPSEDGDFGWGERAGVLRWHPDGVRLTTNNRTSGIALIDRGRYVGLAYPDQTRDHEVIVAWVDDRIFTDTGAFFEIKQGDNRFKFDPTGSPWDDNPGHALEIQWNATIGAVVGSIGRGIAAYDPVHRKLLYQSEFPPQARGAWSADGRWYAQIVYGNRQSKEPFAADQIEIYSGDDGQQKWVLKASLTGVRALRWGPEGALLVSSEDEARVRTTPSLPARAIDIVKDGRIQKRIDLGPRRVRYAKGPPESAALTWSPSGEFFALALDGQDLQIRNGKTGQEVITFPAPAPTGRGAGTDSGGLIWLEGNRLALVGDDFVSFWTTTGQKVAEFVRPGER